MINNSEDWLIFRHLKAEQAFYLALVFRWEDRAEDIIQRPCFQALIGATATHPSGTQGRVLISAGAMNFMEDEIDAAFTLTASGAERSDPVDIEEKEAFDTLLNKYFFATKPSERPYQEAMLQPSTLDPVITKRALALMEEHRRRVAIERVPHATPLQPVRLFERYHYNGHFVVFREAGHGMRPLPGFDAATTVQQPWGASDARHVAVRGNVIETDPAKFRVIKIPVSEGEAFYRDDTHVYTPDCRRIEGADAKTLAFVGGMFARDKHRWYALDGRSWPTSAQKLVSTSTLYYTRNTFLIGDRAVYMGTMRLPVDAATFTDQEARTAFANHVRDMSLAWCADKDGDLIICDGCSPPALSLNARTQPQAAVGRIRAS